MSEVLFYHLEGQPLERVLPALLEKTVERGWRAVVETSSRERATAIDAMLWSYRDDSFLPHATDTSPAPQNQPILLTASDENANAASVRFLVDGAEPPAVEAYERIVFMFDGYDAYQLEMARNHWKRLKTEGHFLTYWQQSPEGRWQKKA